MRDSLAEEWSMYPAMNRFFDDPGRQIPLADDVRWEGNVSDLQWVIYAYGTAAFESYDSFNPEGADEFIAWSSASGRDPFRFPIDDEHPTDHPMHVKAQRATGVEDGDELWVARFPDDGVGCCYYYSPRTRKFMLQLWTL